MEEPEDEDVPHHLRDQDLNEIDEDFEDEDPGDACGRWSNGRLGQHCSQAGTEWCDFECPYR